MANLYLNFVETLSKFKIKKKILQNKKVATKYKSCVE